MTNLLFEIAGTVGSICFVAACIPMAWKTFRLGHDIGNPISTIWTFVVATFATSLYLYGIDGLRPPADLTMVEFVCWSLAAWYHYFPRMRTKGFWRVGYCSRPYGHQGVCNGWKRDDCGTLPCNHEPVPALEGGAVMCRQCGIEMPWLTKH